MRYLQTMYVVCVCVHACVCECALFREQDKKKLWMDGDNNILVG